MPSYKKHILLPFLFLCHSSFSQFTLAKFPGGEDSLKSYIGNDSLLTVLNPGLKKVYFKVYIDPEGIVYDAEILNSFSYELDEAIINMALNMPKWLPAKENEKNIKSIRTLQTENNKDLIYTAVEVIPAFPGGTKSMYEFIDSKMGGFREKENDSKEVFVKFVVDENGLICCGKFLTEANQEVKDHVLKVLSEMPRWTPGRQNNIASKVYFTMPFHYSLPTEEKNFFGFPKRDLNSKHD